MEFPANALWDVEIEGIDVSVNVQVTSEDEARVRRDKHNKNEARCNVSETNRRGWRGDPEGHSAAGAKGGQAVMARYGAEHMKELGRKGGQAVSSDAGHMAAIGRLGDARSKRR